MKSISEGVQIMKNTVKRIFASLLAFTLVFSAVACGKQEPPAIPDGPDTPDTPDTPEVPTANETVYIVKDGKTEYNLVYSRQGIDHSSYAKELNTKINMELLGTGDSMSMYNYKNPDCEEQPLEILIGETDRAVSQELAAAVKAKGNNGTDLAWGYTYREGKLAYYANCPEALEYSWQTFMNYICKPSTVEIKNGVSVIEMKDRDEYIYETTYLDGGKYFTENKIDYDNGVIKADVVHSDKYSTVTIDGGGYSLARIVSEIGTVKPNYFYDIDVKTESTSGKSDIDVLEIWYAQNGREISMQYVDPDKLSLSPEGAARLVVYVLVRGTEADTVKVSIPKIRTVKEYESRDVIIAAVTPTRTPVSGRARTMQDNLNDALASIDALCANAATKPDLILLTEIFNTIGITFASPHDSYIRLDSDFIKALQGKAKEHAIYLSFSFSEIDDNGYYYNSAPLIDRDGNIVLNYHKSHLTMKELAKGVIPGDEVMVYDTDFGRVGMAVCWDLFFNDFVDILAEKNVDIIINPSFGYWDDINSMRAEDSGAYILTAGQSANMTAITRPEGCYNPDLSEDFGNVIGRGDKNGNNGVVVAKIDLNERFRVKYLSSSSTSERPNVYDNEDRPDLYEKYK